jgi:hypothetical protein
MLVPRLIQRIPAYISALLSVRSLEREQLQFPLFFSTSPAFSHFTTTLQVLHFVYILSTNVSTEYFKHAAHSPFFSSKCHLFHNATFFGSCVIHILHTGCAKI